MLCMAKHLGESDLNESIARAFPWSVRWTCENHPALLLQEPSSALQPSSSSQPYSSTMTLCSPWDTAHTLPAVILQSIIVVL